MALLFCCPVCGSNLRVPRSAAVATVACPGCREPIHVPRQQCLDELREMPLGLGGLREDADARRHPVWERCVEQTCRMTLSKFNGDPIVVFVGTRFHLNL